MLFNSYPFIFVFLPCAIVACLIAVRLGPNIAAGTLCFASLAFYTWWYPPNLILLLISTVANFGLGIALGAQHRPALRKALLAAGIVFNLGFIGYFKYINFAIENANALLGTDWVFANVVLPLGISFYTFQKIAYLVDIHNGLRPETSPLRFLLFVSFFPQLIAGPIVHYTELAPQFSSPRFLRFAAADVSVGVGLFAMGLFKKVVLADTAATFATPVFQAADQGASPDLLQSWGAALAYTFQLYFDFSGYSDMAIGLARLFGIDLPQNFNSPYKACSIIDFWRRWHMTLSRFLRDFLYVPLGGNRRGPLRRQINLFITMLLGGLWHGASWNFVLWGALHGVYLMINRAWQAWAPAIVRDSRTASLAGWALTFLAVVVGWVFFRAATLDGSLRLLAGMAGLNGVALPASLAEGALGRGFGLLMTVSATTRLPFEIFAMYAWITLLGAIALFAPNSEELFRGSAVKPDARRPDAAPTSLRWALATGALAAVGLGMVGEPSEFLYFQF